jgi:hypothetical protein
VKITKTPPTLGTQAHDRLRGLPINAPVQISAEGNGDSRGGPFIVAKHGVAVKDNRSKSSR